MKVLHFTQFNCFSPTKEALILEAKEVGLELDLIEVDIANEDLANLLDAPLIENLDAVLVSSFRRSSDQKEEDFQKLFGNLLYRYLYLQDQEINIVLVNTAKSDFAYRPTGNFKILHPFDTLQGVVDDDEDFQSWHPLIFGHPLFEGTKVSNRPPILQKYKYDVVDVDVVAEWDDGLPMMGIRKHNEGLIIALGFETGEIGSKDGLRVVLNALRLKKTRAWKTPF